MNFERDNGLVERVKANTQNEDVLELVRRYESATFADYRDKEKFAAEAVEDFINGFDAEDEIAKTMANTHPTLQQSFMRVCLLFIKRMSEKTHYDARNEAAAKAAKKMIEALGDNTYMPLV